MKLVIGGYAQGKLNYVLSKYHLQEDAVWDSVIPEAVPEKAVLSENAALSGDMACSGNKALPEHTVVMDHLHIWVRDRMLNGGSPEEEIMAFLDRCGNCVLISDEVGNGIVPVEPFEREYRERVGRILVRLADRAEEVERVLCGIGQKIK